MFKFINEQDHLFIKWISKFKVSRNWEQFLNLYTRIGDGYIWAILGIVIFTTNPLNEALITLREACLTGLISVIVYKIIKETTRRPRPYEVLGGKAEVHPMDKFSFPSGHTMNNLAVGFALSYTLPLIGWVVIFTSISWGLLRVWFKVHYLTDVLAGIALAYLCNLIGHEINQLISIWVPWANPTL
jgi:undecaprenyl-diphosphatase